MIGRYVVIVSEDSGERYAERMVLRGRNPVVRGVQLAERYMETGETVRIGEVKAESTDDAMWSDDIKWFCSRQIGVSPEEEYNAA